MYLKMLEEGGVPIDILESKYNLSLGYNESSHFSPTKSNCSDNLL